jgi:hypothetical protein
MIEPSPPRHVVVVRTDRPDVFERLQALVTPGVDLVRDRRRQERRTGPGSVSVDRRTQERRREPPPTWANAGFVIVRQFG